MFIINLVLIFRFKTENKNFKEYQYYLIQKYNLEFGKI